MHKSNNSWYKNVKLIILNAICQVIWLTVYIVRSNLIVSARENILPDFSLVFLV